MPICKISERCQSTPRPLIVLGIMLTSRMLFASFSAAPRHDIWDFGVRNCDPLKIIEEFGDAPRSQRLSEDHAGDTA